MLHFSQDERYTSITLRLNRQLLVQLLRIALVGACCVFTLNLFTDSGTSLRRWDGKQTLDDSMVQRKLLNIDSLDPSELKRKHQSMSELLQKLRRHKSGVTCADVFGGNLSVPWTPEQAKRAKLFDAKVTEQVILPLLQQNFTIEGNSGTYPDQWRLYFELANLDFVKVICETGFNAGHSAFMWLNVNPDVRVYSFDIGIHHYTRIMAQTLESMFPGRLHVTYGDSRETVPRFHEENPHISCDMAVVDGGHHENIPRKDLENLNRMARSMDNILILDDWPGLEDVNETIGQMWRDNLASNKVKEFFYCMKNNSFWKNGVTIGQYN